MLSARALTVPSLFLATLLAAACGGGGGGSTPDPDASAPDAGAGEGGDAGPRERRPLAALWGAPLLVDENPDPNVVEVRLEAAVGRATFDDKEIDVYTYNGMVPGPTLQARPGQKVIVHFTNKLTEATTVHWHGLRISDKMDGSPAIQAPVQPGASFTYEFVVPEAATFWYHPHVNTHDQLERGLYGAIVIQDDLDPLYDLERVLTLDDVLLDANGAIAPVNLSGLDALTGRWGKHFLTNGKKASLARAQAKKGQVERWRITNVANARKMPLEIVGARARLIATDGGLLARPMDLTGRRTLPVGGRMDLEVSYDTPGQARLQMYDADVPVTMFAVDVADAPEAPRAFTWPTIKPAIEGRPVSSNFEMTFDFQQNQWTINGAVSPMAPILTVPKGSTVQMRLRNTGGGVEHPFHLHGQFFRIVGDPTNALLDTVQVPDRGPVDIVAYLDNPGMWMAHCHILEHAAVGMMSEIEVLDTNGASQGGAGGGHGH